MIRGQFTSIRTVGSVEGIVLRILIQAITTMMADHAQSSLAESPAKKPSPRRMMSERELFALFEGASDAAFVVTERGEICSWNAAAERLFGYRQSEVLHKPCYKLLEGRDTLGVLTCTENCAVRECVAKDAEIPTFDLEGKIRSGRRVWVSLSTLVYENPLNGRRLIVHMARDIAERKHDERVLRQMVHASKRVHSILTEGAETNCISPMSEQETEILRLFAEGKNSTTIARHLGITLRTLRNHLHHVNQKLGTHNRLEAVMQAVRQKLL